MFFKAPTIYTLVGLVGQYCTPQEAAQIISRYANRLLTESLWQIRKNGDLRTFQKIIQAFARFLWRFLGDFDTRTRWRSTCGSRLAQLGNLEIIDDLVQLL